MFIPFFVSLFVHFEVENEAKFSEMSYYYFVVVQFKTDIQVIYKYLRFSCFRNVHNICKRLYKLLINYVSGD